MVERPRRGARACAAVIWIGGVGWRFGSGEVRHVVREERNRDGRDNRVGTGKTDDGRRGRTVGRARGRRADPSQWRRVVRCRWAERSYEWGAFFRLR